MLVPVLEGALRQQKLLDGCGCVRTLFISIVGVCVCAGIGIGDGVVVVVMDFSRRGEPANTILLELISVLVSLNVFFISVCEEGQKLFDVVVSEPCSCHFFLSGALPTGVSSNM